jgi:hypothetical protein
MRLKWLRWDFGKVCKTQKPGFEQVWTKILKYEPAGLNPVGQIGLLL